MNNMYSMDVTPDHHSFAFSKSIQMEAGETVYPQHYATHDSTGAYHDEAANFGSGGDERLIYCTWFDGHLVTPIT